MSTPTVEDFARRLLHEYGATLDAVDRRLIGDDIAAGEFEVAAITVVEQAPNVAAATVDELERYATGFDGVDAEVAAGVVANRRL